MQQPVEVCAPSLKTFFGTLQLELLDRRHWETRDQLASAIFDYVEAFYNPRRRHSSIENFSPAEFESRHIAAADAAITEADLSGRPGQAQSAFRGSRASTGAPRRSPRPAGRTDGRRIGGSGAGLSHLRARASSYRSRVLTPERNRR